MMRYFYSLFISILFLLLSDDVYSAQSEPYCDLGFGWHFYCDDIVQEDIKEKVQEPKERDYKAELEEMQQNLEYKKTRAVVDPTPEHIKEYMSYQEKMLEKSSQFSNVWRKVLWESPELDYTLTVPTNTMAKHKWIDEKRDDIVKNLKSLNERYGLFFIYRSTCPYCHKYSPVIKSFGKEYDIDIVAISADNKVIQGWENNTMNDASALANMGIEIKSVPATILYDSEKKEVITVGFGILSRTDLENRIFLLTNLEKNENF